MGTLSLGYAERLIMGVGAKPALIAGLTLAGAGLLLFTQAPVDANYVTQVLPVMLLLGGGAGLCFPALMTLAMSGATESDAGLASGFVNTTVQVGGAIGLAVLATIATERTDGLLADGGSSAAALNSGYHLAYLIGAALVAIAIVVAVAVLRPEKVAAAEQDAEVDLARGEPAYSEAG
jgi:MFS family permease